MSISSCSSSVTKVSAILANWKTQLDLKPAFSAEDFLFSTSLFSNRAAAVEEDKFGASTNIKMK